MKILLVGAIALSLSGCATLQPANDTTQKTLTVLRAAHYTLCTGVVKAHDAGVLTGEKFNQAKELCIRADQSLDAADDALIFGRIAEAAAEAKNVDRIMVQLKGIIL